MFLWSLCMLISHTFPEGCSQRDPRPPWASSLMPSEDSGSPFGPALSLTHTVSAQISRPNQIIGSSSPRANILGKQGIQSIECSLNDLVVSLPFLHQSSHREAGEGPDLHHCLQGLVVPPRKGCHEQRRKKLHGQHLQSSNGQCLVLQQALTCQFQESSWGWKGHPDESALKHTLGKHPRSEGSLSG